MERNSRSKQLVWCKQATCNCQELHAKSSMLHPGKQAERRIHVRSYIPQVGHLFSLTCSKEQSQHIVTAKTIKKIQNGIYRKKKKKRPPLM